VDNPIKQQVDSVKIGNRVSVGTGINLVPKATEQEIVLEGTKSTFNLSGALAILIFVVISMVIFGYNVVTKIELNNAKLDVSKAETAMQEKSDLVVMNEEMLKRIRIFNTVQTNAVSYKDVFDYWQLVSNTTSSLENIKLSSALNFTVNGTADSVSDVAKMWHLLSTDKRVINVNLKSMGAGTGSISYEFEGTLDYDYFKELNLSK
jgi:hypothetical protein